jgi:hypothetical protein
MRTLSRFVVSILSILALAGAMSAAENKLMHCFAFTAIDTATDAEWQAFFKATDALPGKIPGVTKVWYGKLRAPLTVFNPDGDTRKKITKEAAKVNGDFGILRRQWGVCMEIADEAALKTYAADPAHKEWMAVYEKVRVAGTTTYDIIPAK